MAANNRRHKPRDRVVGGNEAIDEAYNVYAGALKTLPVTGALTVIGNAATVQNCQPGQLIAFFNPGATALYVAFGATDAVVAPSAGGGPALVAGQYTILAVPIGNNWFIANGTAYAYLVQDDSTIN